MPRDIVFLGSSHLGLGCLLQSGHFLVREGLCLINRLALPLRTVASEHSLSVKTFDGFKAFRSLVRHYPTSMPFFIYQLDMLVPADLTEEYAFFNVHRGNLRTNRGPNPDVWPIMNGDAETSLSLHKINDKVDSGILIDTFDVQISSRDDTVSVREKLEKGLPGLIESLHHYLQGSRSGTVLCGGVYRPWIKEADFTLDLSEDPLEVIDRKIRSQRQYNGAILLWQGQKHYITEIVEAKPRESGAGQFLIAEKSFVRTCSFSHVLVLRRNEKPRFPPPPVRPPSKRI
jgi:methionyl-tRNA formyltransferase